AAVLQKAGQEVSFVELAFESQPIDALERAIAAHSPQALGFTLWTTQYEEFTDLLGRCGAAAGIPVVAGGPHVGAAARDVLDDGFVRVAVRGEGESIAAAIFEALDGRGELSSIPGIAFVDDAGSCVETPDVALLDDLDALATPPYDLFDVRRYLNRLGGLPVVDMMTARGCPHKCAFCSRGPTGGRKMRLMSPARVVGEMEQLEQRFGYRAFYFLDDIFTLRRRRIAELSDRLIEAGHQYRWACQTRVDCVDRELLESMQRAGCVSIHFGVESGNQQILDRLRKKITVEQARVAVRDCREVGIPTMAYFMLGTPWDTAQTERESIDLAVQLAATVTLFFATIPYPGTELRQASIERGLPVPERPSEYREFFSERETAVDSRESAWLSHYREVHQRCRAATREVLFSQIKDLASYPKLLREFHTQYGVIGFASRVAARLRNLL
ncbi:MAG: B12-binding domain-containing radical SAM protein, partial [Deltaproteobacteria bacterium]|nr:B12-binding domain-containing radical SAM protein [Deltaproteobacteria bacterium]